MSQPASFIPPDVIPPDPPGMKAISFIFSIVMSLLLLAFIGYLCVDFLADFVGYPMPYDVAQERIIQDECGPFISDLLGLNFPGQYALKFGKNARFDRYPLTEDERTFAIQQFRHVLQNSKEVTMEIVRLHNGQQYVSEKFLLSYDSDLADKLCTQIDLTKDTHIPPLDNMYVPDVVFTFSPSEVKINMMANPPLPSAQLPFVYITLGRGMQRWEGSFGSGFTAALLNSQLQRGETVHSFIQGRIPTFP